MAVSTNSATDLGTNASVRTQMTQAFVCALLNNPNWSESPDTVIAARAAQLVDAVLSAITAQAAASGTG